MRARLPVVAAAAIAATVVGIAGYRVLAEEYRYFQWIELGDELLTDDLAFQASRAYGSAIRIDPEEPIAFVKRSYAEQLQGNLSPALDDLETAQALSADLALVTERQGDLYYELKRFDEAAASYETLLDSDPEAPVILYKLGLVYFRAGKETEALDALSRATSLRDGFWEGFYLRAAVFRALGRADAAEADLRRAIDLTPDVSTPRKALIELLLESGALERAAQVVQDEIDTDPGAAASYLDLARVYRQGSRTAEAIDAVTLALEQDPNLPAAYLALGELWLEVASRDGDSVALYNAVTALETVSKMEPGNGTAALVLGRAYLAAGDESRGFAELERASRQTPVPAEAHRLLGDLYRARSNHDEAITAYHVFLMLRGDRPDVLERLGDTYSEVGRPGQAAETYLKLVALEPNRVGPMVKAASALLASGDVSEAARVCRQGLSANPENKALLDILAATRTGAAARPPRGVLG